MTRQGVAAALVAAAVGAAGLAACGSGTKTVAAGTLLAEAHTTINAASAVHFTLSSSRLPNAGTVLKSGSGDLARPDKLRGTFEVSIDGLPADIATVETAGVFYVKLPFATGYQISNPKKFGFGNPASLIDPNTGISRLLTQVTGAKVAGRTRLSGELLETVTGTVPGGDISQFLPDVDPSQPVHLELAINPSTSQVRQVHATGPFATATTPSTYVLTLTDYSEAVTITAPST